MEKVVKFVKGNSNDNKPSVAVIGELLAYAQQMAREQALAEVAFLIGVAAEAAQQTTLADADTAVRYGRKP